MNNITELKPNQIFVFGSNLNGNHAGGAARQALEFGAIMGKPHGIQGQSYAIPTLGTNMEKLNLVEIGFYIKGLTWFAKQNLDKEFLLTPIGTGIAGFSFEEINSITQDLPSNIIKVGEWK